MRALCIVLAVAGSARADTSPGELSAPASDPAKSAPADPPPDGSPPPAAEGERADAASTAPPAPRDVLAAIAPAADARMAIAIGPAGQVYEPDGKGAWVRSRAGGLAADVVAVHRVGDAVIAGASNAPLFRLEGGAWRSVHLEHRAKARLGAGARALAAVGKSIYALDGVKPTRLATAPAAVTSLAGGAGVVVTTAKGVHALHGGTWKPIATKATVIALVSDRWALLDRGALDLATLRSVSWPPGASALAATAHGDTLRVAITDGAQLELATVKAGKLVREPVPLAGAIAGIVADAKGRVVVAARDGQLAVRDSGAWTVTRVRDELPAPRPGPRPAASP